MDLCTHPAFQNVDQEFLHTLQQTLDSVSIKSEIEMIGTLMVLSNEAKNKNIQITPPMQSAIFEYLKNCIPDNKRKQFEALVTMLTSQMYS